MAVQITLQDHWLKRSDFIGLSTSELLCEITATIWPRGDGMIVQVTHVRALGYRADLVSFLTHASEQRLCALLITYYLNSARSGLEGDMPEQTA